VVVLVILVVLVEVYVSVGKIVVEVYAVEVYVVLRKKVLKDFLEKPRTEGVQSAARLVESFFMI
jgi:hypothetical protein